MRTDARTVVVLGASDNRERYSNRAVRRLRAKGHRVIPVHPRLRTIEDLAVVNRLDDIAEDIHTLTVYVGAARSSALIEPILALNPERVILNPGAENPELESALEQKHIRYLRACTLVMLETGQF